VIATILPKQMEIEDLRNTAPSNRAAHGVATIGDIGEYFTGDAKHGKVAWQS
jgi:hypothetical protein